MYLVKIMNNFFDYFMGGAASALNDKVNLCPDRRLGSVTFLDFWEIATDLPTNQLTDQQTTRVHREVKLK